MKALRKILFICGILLLSTHGCKEKDDCKNCACGIDEPQENIEWLKYILDRRFCTEVYLYKYKGQEFIGVHDCPNVYDGGWKIYNCDGTMYCQFVGLNAWCNCPADFLKNAKKTLIYVQYD